MSENVKKRFAVEPDFAKNWAARFLMIRAERLRNDAREILVGSEVIAESYRGPALREVVKSMREAASMMDFAANEICPSARLFFDDPNDPEQKEPDTGKASGFKGDQEF